MTTDIERQFFDTFGIEPTRELIFRTMNCACGCHDCKNCDKYKNNFQKKYPQLTDSILLKLICIWNNACLYLEDSIAPIDYQKITEIVLEYFIDIENYRFAIDKQEIKQQVRTLFEER